MNVLFASPGYGIRSIGDDAMLVAIADGLKLREPDAQALVRHAVAEQGHYNAMGIGVWQNLDHPNRELSVGRRFYGLNHGDPKPTYITTKVHERIMAANVLVLGGGEVFLDITHDRWRGPVAYYELLVTLARFCGTPVVLAGASVNGEIGAACQESMRFIMDNCDAVILRDHVSECYARAFGYGGPIEVLPDPAIGLESRPWPGADALFDMLPTPLIGVALRWCYWQDHDFGDWCDYWAGVCDTVAEELGGSIVFIPFNLYDVDDEKQDDRYLAKEISWRMRSPFVRIEEYRDPREQLALVEHMDLVIAVRHHGAVFGVRAGVPTVAVPYSEKTTAFMHGLGMRSFEPGEIVAAVRRIAATQMVGTDLVGVVEAHRKAWTRYVEVINEVAR